MSKELVSRLPELPELPELPRSPFLPEVRDRDGGYIKGPEIDAVLRRVTEMAQVAQLARIRISLEKNNFQGEVDPRYFTATDQLQFVDLITFHPNAPWLEAEFFNTGSNNLFISMNVPDKLVPIGPGGRFLYNAQHADKKLNLFYYSCSSGVTTTFFVLGKY